VKLVLWVWLFSTYGSTADVGVAPTGVPIAAHIVVVAAVARMYMRTLNRRSPAQAPPVGLIRAPTVQAGLGVLSKAQLLGVLRGTSEAFRPPAVAEKPASIRPASINATCTASFSLRRDALTQPPAPPRRCNRTLPTVFYLPRRTTTPPETVGPSIDCCARGARRDGVPVGTAAVAGS